MGGRAFIVTQSIKKLSDTLKKSVFNDFDYKIIDADKAVDLGLYEEKILKNGKVKRVKATGLLKQRIIITFSRMKRVTHTKSGEKAAVEYLLDEAKIAEEEKYEGYYAVATNLLDPAKGILNVSHKRYQIEDCFLVIKTNFTGRPVNHRLPNRIKAHYLICYTALLEYRLLEAKLDDQETHVTPQDLITT